MFVRVGWSNWISDKIEAAKALSNVEHEVAFETEDENTAGSGSLHAPDIFERVLGSSCITPCLTESLANGVELKICETP